MPLFLDQVVDVLFDGPLGDEFEHLDTPVLADSVDPVGRLVFPSGVPPPVVMDDDRGRDEVDSDAGRLEGGDEDFAARVVCKTGQFPFPVAG